MLYHGHIDRNTVDLTLALIMKLVDEVQLNTDMFKSLVDVVDVKSFGRLRCAPRRCVIGRWLTKCSGFRGMGGDSMRLALRWRLFAGSINFGHLGRNLGFPELTTGPAC